MNTALWHKSIFRVALTILLLIGLTMVCFGGHDCLFAWRAANWPSTAGTVSRSFIKDVDEPVSADGSKSQPRAEILYDYTANGKQFQSDQLYFQGQIGGSKHYFPPYLAEAYRVGMKVQVAYDPAEPSQAVLLPLRNSVKSVAIVLTGGCLIAICFVSYHLTRARALVQQ